MAAEARSEPGGSAALLSFVEEHRSALEFDFEHLLHRSLPDVEDPTVSLGPVLERVVQILRRRDSNTFASVAGYHWVAGAGEIAQLQLLESYLEVHRDEERQREPVRVDMPWMRPESPEQVTPERRRELRAQLEARSAFRGR